MKKLMIISLMVAAAAVLCAACGSRKEAAEVPRGPFALSNPSASEAAANTYEFICSNYGEHMISCQQESTWMDSPDYEMNFLLETTGKLPAMRGLDFMNDDFDGVVAHAKEWHSKGGLATICWHSGVNGLGYEESKKDRPDFDKLLTEGTPEHSAMLANWDRAAYALGELQKDGIPVLWRPFHEFDGKWFWWGKGGNERFIELWRLMYDYFTKEKELNNLIWVLGYSDKVRSGWYPGDGYCDIIGSDVYDGSTNIKGWNKLLKLGINKPMAFHECGNVPSVGEFEKDGDMWAWFMIWHTEYLTKNDKANLADVYNSDKVITLDELPFLGGRE